MDSPLNTRGVSLERMRGWQGPEVGLVDVKLLSNAQLAQVAGPLTAVTPENRRRVR